MATKVLGAVADAARGVLAAARARPGTVLGTALVVFAIGVLAPPLLLSIVRKPVDYVTFNPWLKRLPDYLASNVPWREKLGKLPDLALFWCSADSPFGGTEWGFAVDVRDLARLLLTSLLFGLYFALWRTRRDRAMPAGGPVGAARSGGIAGALVSVVGLSTGPCSVIGCGAPVLPVVGLAFVGLSSGTLTLLSGLSRMISLLVLVGLGIAVLALGWSAARRGL